MRFEVNPASSRELRKDMISRELTGAPYSKVPEEVMQTYPIQKQQEPQTKVRVEPEFEFVPEPQAMKTPQPQDPLQTAALKTVDFEARKDKAGNVAVYQLPSGDGGGTFEVAGINDRYHPGEATRLASLPPEQRAEAAAQYIRKYTAPVVDMMPQPVKAFTQDMVFNRGPTGAVRYFQRGLNSLGQNLDVDGKLGPKTLSAIQAVEPRALMRAASLAQLEDEKRMAEQNPARKKFLTGLENRIRNRLSVFGSI